MAPDPDPDLLAEEPIRLDDGSDYLVLWFTSDELRRIDQAALALGRDRQEGASLIFELGLESVEDWNG